LIALLTRKTHGVLIPPPKPHDMSWEVAHARTSLVDTSRKDPYSPSEDRKLGVSIFVPVFKPYCTKQCDNVYMPDQTARTSNLQFFGDENANVFEKLYFKSCCASYGETDLGAHRLVVLEPGVATSREVYNQLARQMSANGFVVVTIDHPHDASIVEFLDANDKSVIANNGTVDLCSFSPATSWNDTVTKAVDARTDDINFMLTQLSNISLFERLFPDLKLHAGSPLNSDSFVIMGHGLGGTVATMFSAQDKRTVFSINLSGTTPVLQTDVKNHVIFFGRDEYTRDDDANWKQSWKHFTGSVVEWDMHKGGQMDYTDLPLMVSL
ncbi:hypothetical protein BU26DRAFT_397650, partial [Trematosphaeria pertusa]